MVTPRVEKLRAREEKILESKTIFSQKPPNPSVIVDPRFNPISFLFRKTNNNAFSTMEERTNTVSAWTENTCICKFKNLRCTEEIFNFSDEI